VTLPPNRSGRQEAGGSLAVDAPPEYGPQAHITEKLSKRLSLPRIASAREAETITCAESSQRFRESNLLAAAKIVTTVFRDREYKKKSPGCLRQTATGLSTYRPLLCAIVRQRQRRYCSPSTALSRGCAQTLNTAKELSANWSRTRQAILRIDLTRSVNIAPAFCSATAPTSVTAYQSSGSFKFDRV
jgi:hypothetical protein